MSMQADRVRDPLGFIRPMTSRDVPKVSHLLATDTYATWEERHITSSLAAYDIAWVIEPYCCENQDTLLGFLLAKPQYDEVHILCVFIKAMYRNQGFGLFAIEALKTYTFTYAFKRILLEVRASNRAAQAVYKKAGFKSIGTRKDYYPPHRLQNRVLLADDNLSIITPNRETAVVVCFEQQSGSVNTKWVQ